LLDGAGVGLVTMAFAGWDGFGLALGSHAGDSTLDRTASVVAIHRALERPFIAAQFYVPASPRHLVPPTQTPFLLPR
jgi:hypothetical protein